MKWPIFSEIKAEISLLEGYALDQLRKEEVDYVLSQIPKWYPDAIVGEESYHLDRNFWLEKCQFLECHEDRPYFPLTFWSPNQEMIGFMTLEKNSRSLTLTGRLGAVSVEHRGIGLANVCPRILDVFAESIGAEAIVQIVTLKAPHMQLMAERNGYFLCGLLPGYDRDMVRPGEVKRVYEAYYIKLLVPESKVEIPLEEALTENTKRFWNLWSPSKPLKSWGAPSN